MASVREKPPGSGRWEIRVFVGNDDRGRPKQVSRSFTGSKRAAVRRAADLERELAGVQSSAVEMTVTGLLNSWIDAEKANWKPLTVRDYRRRADAIIEDTSLSDIRVLRLTPSHIDQWITRLRTADVGEREIVNRYRVLKSALNRVRRLEQIPSNPMEKVPLKQPRRRERDLVPDDLVGALLRAARRRSSRHYLAVRLALTTGCRRSELAGLRWDDLNGNQLLVRRQVYVEHGERRILDQLKAGESRRSVSVDEPTATAWAAAMAEMELPSCYVFGEPGSVEPPSPDRPYRLFKHALGDVPGAPNWRLHDLRHWSSTTGLDRGFSVKAVADRAGNLPETMLSTYAHTNDETAPALGRAIGAVLDELEGLH